MNLYSCASYAMTNLVEIWYGSFQSNAVEQLWVFFKFSAFQSVNEVLPISYTCMCVYIYIYIYIYIYKTCTTYVTGGAHDFLSYY